MSEKNKKEFGIWMDSHHATVVGRESVDNGDFKVLGHAVLTEHDKNSGEKATHNAEKSSLHKYFKEITSFLENAEELHVTGTGTAQEQFIHFIAEMPPFRNTVAKESTSNKMGDDKLVEYITERFN